MTTGLPQPALSTELPARAGRLRPAVWAVVLAGVIHAACGKQGPPLAPLTPHPARVADLTARRIGNTVYVSFTVPKANQEGSTPADLERVDVYAFTASRPDEVKDVKDATLVGKVLVRRPPNPDENEKKKKRESKTGATPAAKATPPEPGLDQGALAVVAEPLTAGALVPVVVKATRRLPSPVTDLAAAERGPLVGVDTRGQLSRYYVAVGVSRRGRKSAPSEVAGVPLVPPPPRVAEPAPTVTEKAVTVAWAPPTGVRKPVQEPAGKEELASKPLGISPPAPLGYNVYLVEEPSPGPAAPAAESVTMPVPLNDKPVTSISFDDEKFEFGKPRCYSVAVVERVAGAVIEGERSPSACVTPKDTFPPPAPTALAAVAGESAISLIWEGVETADFAGYLVLRGESPSGSLEPITPAPIRETTYRDSTARPGVRYVYAVVAVDNAVPPNRSLLSNKVEEGIR